MNLKLLIATFLMLFLVSPFSWCDQVRKQLGTPSTPNIDFRLKRIKNNSEIEFQIKNNAGIYTLLDRYPFADNLDGEIEQYTPYSVRYDILQRGEWVRLAAYTDGLAGEYHLPMNKAVRFTNVPWRLYSVKDGTRVRAIISAIEKSKEGKRNSCDIVSTPFVWKRR